MAWNRKTLCIFIISCVVVSLHLAIVCNWHESVTRIVKTANFDTTIFKPNIESDSSTPKASNDGTARAYVQYATNLNYFCNALIDFDRLAALGTQYDTVLMYPEDWLNSSGKHASALEFASRTYPSLTLIPQPLISVRDGHPTWEHSLTKLNIFAFERYSRILYFDSDTLILKSMDQYFDAPPAQIALPRAYWLMDDPSSGSPSPLKLGSHVMLVQPDLSTFDRIVRKINETQSFDMEIVNYLFGSSAMVLPHRGLAMLSGEFRTKDHSRYLGEGDSDWDADKELEDSHLVHFSDWPLSKPWLRRTVDTWSEALPNCPPRNVGREDDNKETSTVECPDRRVWVGLYGEYDVERDRVCRFTM